MIEHDLEEKRKTGTFQRKVGSSFLFQVAPIYGRTRWHGLERLCGSCKKNHALTSKDIYKHPDRDMRVGDALNFESMIMFLDCHLSSRVIFREIHQSTSRRLYNIPPSSNTNQKKMIKKTLGIRCVQILFLTPWEEVILPQSPCRETPRNV